MFTKSRTIVSLYPPACPSASVHHIDDVAKIESNREIVVNFVDIVEIELKQSVIGRQIGTVKVFTQHASRGILDISDHVRAVRATPVGDAKCVIE